MRSRSPYRLLTLVLALLAAVVLAACSSTVAAPATTANGSANASTSPTTAPTATAAASSQGNTKPAASREGWPQTFTLGMFAGDDPNKVLLDNDNFRAYLEKRLGIPVKIITGTSYTAVIEAMRAKHVDAMEVGPFSYLLAVQEANAEALGVNISTSAKDPVYDPKLQPYYYSIIITKKGSGIKSVADVKGKQFSFVDPASTSGHLMPKSYLINHGIKPDQDMKTIFAGSHPTSVLAVANGKVDAGATYLGNLYNMVDQGQVNACVFPDRELNKVRTQDDIQKLYDSCPDGNIAIVAMTDPIPETPFAIRGDLPDSFKAEVKAALLAMKDDPDVIRQTKRWYLDPAPQAGLAKLDHFYNPLRDVAKILDLDLKAMK